jgi:RNA polymerase sigma factor (sigma-70 family)
MAERPGMLVRLLEASTPRDEDEAWARLVETHTDVLLRTARYFGGDHDAVMDRYAFILDHLRRDHFSRLRAYRPQDRSGFEVWLVAVARRLCLDHHRHKYGRGPAGVRDHAAVLERAGRRRLVDLLGEALDPDLIARPDAIGADQELARRELSLALAAVLDTLEWRDRLLLHFLFEEDFTAKQIARLMRFPTQFHVYRRRNQLLQLLRERLRDRGVLGQDG